MAHHHWGQITARREGNCPWQTQLGQEGSEERTTSYDRERLAQSPAEQRVHGGSFKVSVRPACTGPFTSSTFLFLLTPPHRACANSLLDDPPVSARAPQTLPPWPMIFQNTNRTPASAPAGQALAPCIQSYSSLEPARPLPRGPEFVLISQPSMRSPASCEFPD